MGFFSSLRARHLSWSRSTPLPANLHDASATFQSWHEFDASVQQWACLPAAETQGRRAKQQRTQASRFVLATWNVDGASVLAARRISAIVAHITASTPAVDIIFLQEVSREALHALLCDARIRQDWYSSEADETNWHGRFFATMTLLSRRRFHRADASPGPVWRYTFPSRFGRDALCCDVFAAGAVRARLVNVHLDSLPIEPSRRPRQLCIVAAVLRSAGRGLVAGDFNPVLAEDAALISGNRLVDAWQELHPDENGFTWGVDGQQAFPPGRLDKVALVGLRPRRMEVMPPGVIEVVDECHATEPGGRIAVPWSDHSGLKCCVEVVGE